MSVSWNTMNDRDRENVGRLFDALSNLDSMQDPKDRDLAAGQDRPRAVGFADIYAFATGPDTMMSPALSEALAGSARLRADLDALLSRQCVYRFPRAAAASSGALESREGDGFSIRLKPSRADGQVYVIIQLEAGEVPPQALVLRDGKGEYQKFDMPDPIGDRVQMLADEDSDLVQALRSVETDIYLQ